MSKSEKKFERKRAVTLLIFTFVVVGALLTTALLAVNYQKNSGVCKALKSNESNLNETINSAMINGSIRGWNYAIRAMSEAVNNCSVSTTGNDTLISFNCFKKVITSRADYLNNELKGNTSISYKKGGRD